MLQVGWRGVYKASKTSKVIATAPSIWPLVRDDLTLGDLKLTGYNYISNSSTYDYLGL